MKTERAAALRLGLLLAESDFRAAENGAYRAHPRRPAQQFDKLEADYAATVDWRLRHLPYATRYAYERTARRMFRAETNHSLHLPRDRQY